MLLSTQEMSERSAVSSLDDGLGRSRGSIILVYDTEESSDAAGESTTSPAVFRTGRAVLGTALLIAVSMPSLTVFYIKSCPSLSLIRCSKLDLI